jgi:AAA15 family ATPase/GTPase
MLVKLTVANFRSIAEPVTFSMEADKDANYAIATGASAAPHLLRTAAVYGANGSGKSNLLAAFATVQTLVSGDVIARPDPDEGLLGFYCPFQFDEELRHSPTSFDVVFLASDGSGEDALFNYMISYNAERIIEERLFVRTIKPRSRDRILLDRVWNQSTSKYDYEFGPSIEGPKERWIAETNETLPFLTVAAKSRAKEFSAAYLWWNRVHLITSDYRNYRRVRSSSRAYWGRGRRVAPTGIMLRHGSITPELVSSFLSRLDVRVSRIEVKDRQEAEGFGIDVQLVSPDRAGRDVALSLVDESEGTRKLFELASSWIFALRRGSILLVDELQNGLHPKALLALIELFKSPEVNTKKAQLVITSHDVTLLKYLKRDEVWFTDKRSDGSTELFSLLEYRTQVREESAFDRQYLEGRFGGVPLIDNIDEFADILHGQRELF